MLGKIRIQRIQKLHQKKFRLLEKRFIAEGTKTVLDLIRANYPMACVIATSDWIKTHLKSPCNAEVIEAEQFELDKISCLHTSPEVLAICEFPVLQASPIENTRLTLVVDAVRDPGNLGTIIRLADWFGVHQIFASDDTVEWTNPWGGHKYIEDIEAREDGGTPGFLQTMRTAMAIVLKEQMGTDNIQKREEEQLAILWKYFEAIPNLNILASQHKHRLGIISFYIDGLHFNLAVKMLNDRFGIQTRGGCSCAGTYGHYLLHVDQQFSNKITNLIDQGDYSQKPGWIRLSIHPVMTDEELHFIGKAVTELAANFKEWANDYEVDLSHMNLKYKNEVNGSFEEAQVEKCFSTF
jgi:hypothetical protein